MSIKYDLELKAKAVRLFQDHVSDYPSRWAAMKAISGRLGMTAETLRQWVRRAEVDAGQVPGLSGESAEELAALRRKCRELEQTVELLTAATSFFARAPLIVPRRRRDELLQLLMVHPQPLSHRLHRLAPPISEQPTHVQLALALLIRTRQASKHCPGEAHKPGTNLDDLFRCHPKITSG
jgi:transposase